MNDGAASICVQLNDERTSCAVRCERATLAALGGGCQLPVGVYAEFVSSRLAVSAAVVSADGQHLRDRMLGPADCPEELGEALARSLLTRGANELLGVV